MTQVNQETLTNGWRYEGGATVPAFPASQVSGRIMRLTNDDSRRTQFYSRLESDTDVLQTILEQQWAMGHRNLFVIFGWPTYENGTNGGGASFIDYDFHASDEAVNAAATFHQVHRALAQFAHEAMADYHPQSSLFDDPMVRSFDDRTVISAGEAQRNAVFQEAIRIMIGLQWVRVHELLKIDPAVAANKTRWQTLETLIRAEHDRIFATAGQHGWPSLVKEEMPVNDVQAKLNAGQHFYFSVSASGAWQVNDEGAHVMGEFEQRRAIVNYSLARREFSRHHGAFRFPAGPPDAVSNAYARQIAIMESLREMANEIQTTNDVPYPDDRTANLKTRMVMKLLYLTAMALLRDGNDNDEALTKIEKNTTIGTPSIMTHLKTLDTMPNAVLGTDEHWTRRGFIYWNGSAFVRDSKASAESAANLDGDDRLGTDVMVVDPSEIHTEINPVDLVQGPDRLWLAEDYWTAKIARELGRPGAI